MEGNIIYKDDIHFSTSVLRKKPGYHCSMNCDCAFLSIPISMTDRRFIDVVTFCVDVDQKPQKKVITASRAKNP
jgi:hypothetical protein